MSDQRILPGDSALFEVLREAATEPPEDYVPGTAAPPPVSSDELSTGATAVGAAEAVGLESGERRAPHEGALFVESEARAQASAQAMARGLVVASEMWALEGDLDRATRCAQDAFQAAPKLSIGGLQLRALARRRGDTEPLAPTLESEARLAASESARCHAALLLSDVLRYRDHDAGRGARAAEVAHRLAPEDLRALLPRLAERLAASENPALVPLPKDSPLRAAAARVAELRGGREAAEPSFALLLNRVREKLSRGDIEGAGLALLAAADAGVAEKTLLELAASLLAHGASGRLRAIAALKRRVTLAPTRATLRTLAARAVEQGDGDSLGFALDAADPASGTFNLAERVVLAHLLGGHVDLGDLDLDVLATQSHAAFAAALAPSAAALAHGSPEARDAALGSALASSQRREELPLALEQLSEADPLRAVLDAEAGVSSQSPEQTARALRTLAAALKEPSLAAASAVISEGAGHVDSAADAYAEALESAPDALWLARAVAETSHGTDLVRALTERAAKTEDAARAVHLLLEAALAATPDDRRASLARARERAPSDVLVHELGSVLAARAGDERAQADWLSALRKCSGSAKERSLAALGEAIALSAIDPRGSAKPLAELAERHKNDVSLSEYAERMGDVPQAERARARLDMEPKSSDDEAWLLSEATWLAFGAGDARTAAKAARALGDKTKSPVASALAELLEIESGDLVRVSDRLLEATRDESDRARQRAAFEELAALDEARGNQTGAMLWQRALLEGTPDHVPALRRLEHQLIGDGRDVEWEGIAAKLAGALPGPDGDAYSLLLGTEELTRGDHQRARKWFEPLARRGNTSLLVVRAMQTLARAEKDLETRFELSSLVAESAHQPADAATSLLRAAEAAAALGRREVAEDLVERALTRRPDDLVALWVHAEALSARLARNEGTAGEVAEAYERLATACRVPEHQAGAWLEAGHLWLTANDDEHAAAAFQRTLAIEPGNAAAFEHLKNLRAADPAALVELLEARRGEAASDSERLELQRALAEAHRALGDGERRRAALQAILELSPGDEAALSELAEVSTELEDYAAARAALEELLETATDDSVRTEAYRSLGALLHDHLEDLPGAAAAYEEVHARDPEDRNVGAWLVRIYAKLGDAERSTNLQTRLIQLAEAPEDKRQGALLLAQLYEHVARDPKRAAATLERTRKAWPLDPAALAAMARFMDRQGDRSARRILVDRTGKEAFRKLDEGRIDPSLLDLLATIAELQGREDQATATRAARSALLGEEESLTGAHEAALDPRLDDLIAPAGMTAPLRTLLRKTGSALDAAFPVDGRAIGARPLDDAALVTHINALSRGAHLGAAEVFVADPLGARCLPVASAREPGGPHRLVVGPGLAELPEGARDFLLLRALKLQQSGMGAFARSRAEDTWPMLAALLMLFAPNWRPADADARKIALARAQIERGLGATGYEDDVPVLVLEAIGGAGGQLSHLGEAGRLMANRAALLGVGSPTATLTAFSALSDKPLADSGPSRERWLNGHAEARDLLLFAASDAHAEARVRVGLAQDVGPRLSEPPRPPQAPGARPPLPSMAAAPRPPLPSLDGGAASREAPSKAPPPPRRGAPPPPKRG